MEKKRFLVVLEKSAHNYSAYSPDVPGCITTGSSVEETLRNMQEALEFHLEGIQEDGEEVPAAHGLQYHVDAGLAIADDDLITSLEVRLPAHA